MGCCVCGRMYLSVCCVSVDWGCCCEMFVHTNRGSCSSLGSHTARTVDLLEGAGVKDSAQCRREVLPVVRGSRRGRRSWRKWGGKTGVEEAWAWEGTVEKRHWAKEKKMTLQGTRLDISPQRKVLRGGQNKGTGTQRGPGGSWKVEEDWE